LVTSTLTLEIHIQKRSLPAKNPAAVTLAKLGGLKGSKARAEKLSTEERQSIARNAALARWKRK
jgi:hypothetical protein